MTQLVTFKRPSLEMAMEFGSLKELAGYLTEEGNLLTQIFGADMETVVKGLSTDSPELPPAPANDEAPKRGRPRNKDKQPDPATANAPPPAPVPGQNAPPPPPAAPVDTAPNANGVPNFLDATKADAPPPPPPAPPAPPPAPPSGILAGKVIAALDARATDDANKKQLADWLAAYKLVHPGATYDESIAAVRLIGDDKLAQVATALAVS